MAQKYSFEDFIMKKTKSNEAKTLRNQLLITGHYANHLTRWMSYYSAQQVNIPHFIVHGTELGVKTAIRYRLYESQIGHPLDGDFSTVVKCLKSDKTTSIDPTINKRRL